MTATDNKASNLGKKRSQKSGSEYLRARKMVLDAIQSLGSKKDCAEDLKAIADKLLDRFVEEERKASI